MPQRNNHRHHQNSKEDTMRIILDDNDIYQAGQSLEGTIVVDLISDVPLNECFISLFCVAKVSWTENPGLRDEGRMFNVNRKLLEILFPLDVCKYKYIKTITTKSIFYSQIDAQADYLPIGHHEIPFEFLVPDKQVFYIAMVCCRLLTMFFFKFNSCNLPSSFQSRFGYSVFCIEYKIGEKTRKREILVDAPITKNLWVCEKSNNY